MVDLSKEAVDNRERAAKDLELYNHWNAHGQKPEHLEPLLQRFHGMIRTWSNRYAGSTRDVDTPPAAVHAEFQKWFLHALDTYDPDKGAALGTWVEGNLRHGQRWVMGHRNFARIPETRVYRHVGEYKNARSVLDEQLGRSPSTIEMADYLKWPEKQVAMVQSEIHKTLTSSGWDRKESMDPTIHMPSRHAEVLDNIYYQLDHREQEVYDYLLGRNGKPQLQATAIANRMGVSPATVTRVKQAIAEKIKGYT